MKNLFIVLALAFGLSLTFSGEAKAQKLIEFPAVSLGTADTVVSLGVISPDQIGSLSKVSIDMLFTGAGADANTTVVRLYQANSGRGLSATNLVNVAGDTAYNASTHGAGGLVNQRIVDLIPKYHDVKLFVPAAADSGTCRVSFLFYD